MRCPFCGAKKERRVWVCAECASPIPRPKKPAYEAAGWEWGAAIAFLVLSLWSFAVGGEEYAVVTAALVWLAVAFAFSAARDSHRIGSCLVGAVCLTFWLTGAAFLGLFALVMGEWKGVVACALVPGYCVLVLLLEDIIWRLQVARM
jgi:hypothetical protein